MTPITKNKIRKASQSKGPGDVAGEAQALALGKVVEAREATNQKLIDFYYMLSREYLLK